MTRKGLISAGICLRILFAIVCGLGMFSQAYGQSPSAFEVSPSTVDFGLVPMFSRAERIVTIRNNSSQTLSFRSSITNISGGVFMIAEVFSRMGFIAAGGSATIRVGFSPADVGLQTGRLDITTSLGNASVDLRGNGTAPQPRVEPTSINFATVPAGQTATRAVTVANTLDISGNSALRFNGPVEITGNVAGIFFLASSPGRIDLDPQQSTTFEIGFRPTGASPFNGTATVNLSLDRFEFSIQISLSGMGGGESQEGPQLAVKPPSLDFSAVNVGGTATRPVALINNGDQPVTVTNLSMATGQDSGFSIISQPSTNFIHVGQSITFMVGFKPAKPDTVEGSILIESTGGNFTLTMRGRGNVSAQPLLVVDPLTLDFGTASVGTNIFRTVTLRNTGDSPLNFSLMMRADGSFFVDSLPSNTIEAGQSITLKIGFRPKAGSGGQTIGGSLGILSGGNETTITLRGNVAVEPLLQVETTSIDFSTINIGETATRTLTMRNASGGQLTFSVGLNGADNGFIFIPPTNTTLEAGESFTLNVSFSPKSTALVTGAVVITSNGGSITVFLRGQGSASQSRLEVTPAAIDFGAINIGAAATRSLTLRNTGQGQLTFSINMNGADAGFSIISQPSTTTLGPGQSVSFDVGFRPAGKNTFNGSLDIISNGGNATIALRGRGNVSQPVIELGTTTLDFGQVLTGESRMLSVTIRNMADLSAGPLEISDVTVSTLEGLNNFEITSRPTGPIPPGGSAELQITFKPTEIDTAGSRGQLIINSNADQPVTLSLVGRGFVRLSFARSGIIRLKEGDTLEVPLVLQGRPPADGLTINLEPQFDGNTLNLLLNQNMARLTGSQQTFLSTRSVTFTEPNQRVTLLLRMQDIEIGPAATFKLGLAADSSKGVELEPLTILLRPNNSPDLLRTFNCQDCVSGFTQEGEKLEILIAFFDQNRDANRLVLRLQNERGEVITLPAITRETVPALPVGARGLVARLRIGNLGNFGRVTSISILLEDAAGNKSSATLPDSAGNTQQSVGIELRMKRDEEPRVESIEIVAEQ